MKRLMFILIGLAVLSFAVTAQAGTQLLFAGQSWHVFKSVGALGQQWDPSMVSTNAGTVTLKINGNKAGGIGSTHYQLYGTYNADFRISAGVGKGVLLLAGHEGTPYNELDFAETSKGDSGRTRITATRHWGVGKTHLLQYRRSGNFALWHNVQVVWKPGAMNVWLDGTLLAHYTSHVSSTPMALKFQTAGANVAGAGAPAQLQVKNVTIS